MIEGRSVFFHQVSSLVLFFTIFFHSLPVTELLPQQNEQFPPLPQYHIPEYSTQFSVIPGDRGQQFPVDDNARALNNFNNYNDNGANIPAPDAVEEHHKTRGQISYSSSLAEDLEPTDLEDHDSEAIPGEAQQDYPVYEEIPRTGFSCRGKYAPAYYADVEARCQVFHICDVGGHKHSFLCPNGSVFNQKYLVCDWWYDFTCENAENLFNKQIVPKEISSVSPNNIESDKIFSDNNNEGFQSQNTQNEYNNNNNYQNNNNNGFIYNQDANQNNFNFPNTQIDIPQQVYTDNVYVPQNDIFHGAETGFPGRELIAENNGNFSNTNVNQNNNNENLENTNNEKQENNNYNLQPNKYNEEINNDKQITKNVDESNIQTNNNVNENGKRKPQRGGRKGNDFPPQYRNIAAGNNKEPINYQNNNYNNEEQVNLIRQQQSDPRNNNNPNFQPLYNNGQIPPNHLQPGNDNHEVNKQQIHPSIQPQLNFAPPV